MSAVIGSSTFRAPVRPGAFAFGTLYGLEAFTRALLLSIIPLEALRLLGNARDVSVLYFGVGVVALLLGQQIPRLIRRFGRRTVYIGGMLLLAGTPAIFAAETFLGQVIGMSLRVLGVGALNVGLNLYVMEYVPRREMVRVEPIKLFCGGPAWIVGPFLGVWLGNEYGLGATYLLTSLSALTLLAVFLRLRLDRAGSSAPARVPPSVLRNLKRFVAQPRLRLAWAISFARSSWWVMFFIYTPALMLETKWGAAAAGLVASAGNAALMAAPLFGRLARRTGVRRIIVASFLILAATSIGAAVAASLPGGAVLAAGLLIVGSFGGAALDALGAIPFLRAAHPYERAEMMTVYGTGALLADLAPAALFAVLLTVLPLPSVFAASGLGVLAVGLLSLKLPRRL